MRLFQDSFQQFTTFERAGSFLRVASTSLNNPLAGGYGFAPIERSCLPSAVGQSSEADIGLVPASKPDTSPTDRLSRACSTSAIVPLRICPLSPRRYQTRLSGDRSRPPSPSMPVPRLSRACSTSAIVPLQIRPLFPQTLSDKAIWRSIPPITFRQRFPNALSESGKPTRGYLMSAIVHPALYLDSSMQPAISFSTFNPHARQGLIHFVLSCFLFISRPLMHG